MTTRAIITGFGSFIPKNTVRNEDFRNHKFFDAKGDSLHYDNELIISKFNTITGIEERRYADNHSLNSDMAAKAAEEAIQTSGIDRETLDYIIFAHNFGDVTHGSIQADAVPSLATRVKHALKIANPNCVAYDILFGCPGWIEGLIQANMFIKAGEAKKCLIIGSETLSRVVDPHDRDSMIYADGAGACILEAGEKTDKGIIAHASQTFSLEEAYYLFNGVSNDKDIKTDTKYIKMYGRKIYEFAIVHVPQALKMVLKKSGYSIDDVKKIFIHQANEKMDAAIIKRFYRLYKKPMPKDIMPMTIHKLGNSSVATIPTLIHQVEQGLVEGQEINPGDITIFASVGAGMNINAVVYRF